MIEFRELRTQLHPVDCVLGVLLLMAVVVAERHGLHAAATRFASVRPLSDSVRAARRAAADAERAVLDASRPSATYGDALLALADAYANAGHAGESESADPGRLLPAIDEHVAAVWLC